MPKLQDGEVIDIDTDGCLICWDAHKRQSYNTGESLAEYGEHNLTGKERNCLRIKGVKFETLQA